MTTYRPQTTYRTRCLGGSLLVIKGCNDCVTIERDATSRPVITRVEGDWQPDQLDDAMAFWDGSEAEQR